MSKGYFGHSMGHTFVADRAIIDSWFKENHKAHGIVVEGYVKALSDEWNKDLMLNSYTLCSLQ